MATTKPGAPTFADASSQGSGDRRGSDRSFAGLSIALALQMGAGNDPALGPMSAVSPAPAVAPAPRRRPAYPPDGDRRRRPRSTGCCRLDAGTGRRDHLPGTGRGRGSYSGGRSPGTPRRLQ